ncbi:MAG: HAMP domain-containing histidine kinase [Bacteroidetes bacterium]|nr:HAMP domain-containing histidine kinase [Bacteroidota bacterium]MBT6685783.1 HAMP domain-containing histidine kinase [Bacteroidota bacterium]MBT7142353.1 HAMP domain-containing histidine kinase [Bacteroidota bacterium]MBT7492033.1 HAMP domain-containing histidine kinase [Bacteroidota bacterium]
MINIPNNIDKYLQDLLIGCQNPVFIKLSKEGKVISWEGNLEIYGIFSISKNVQIEQIVPFLDGIFPLETPLIILPNIQTEQEVYADIHIIKDQTNCWVVLLDKTQDVNKLRNILQKQNETQLMLARSSKKLDKSISIDVLNLFEVVTFERISDDVFKIVGSFPKWFVELFSDSITNRVEFIISDYFPFIQTFLPMAENHWEESDSEKVMSDRWTESNTDGEDFHLQAMAAVVNNKKLLFIQSISTSVEESQLLIQKAREKSLAYDKLAKAENALKKLLKFKDQFVSIVSHDLRSPIAAVVALSDILLQDETFFNKIDESHQSDIIDINEELKRLLDYNNKLYHWSNLELGKFQVYPKKIKLIEIGNVSRKNLSSKMQEKNIKFEMDVDEDIFVDVDEALFSQVLNNLIGNAVKFTPAGGKISLSAIQNPEQTIIKLTDTGVGMPDHARKKLFSDTFDKSTDGTGGEKGTGLGISICKKIIDAHKFEIAVESEQNVGTSFIITIYSC